MRLRALAFAVAVWAGAAAAGTAASAASYAGETPEPGVVWITSGAVPSPAPVEPRVRQSGKAFLPELLVVPVNSSVRFSNDDPYYHSVYSTSGGNAFDLGLYDTGAGKSVTFEHPGVVDVRCHVHASMHASIIVVDGPYARTTQPNERFRLDNVTRGEHVLHVWNATAGETSRTVTVR